MQPHMLKVRSGFFQDLVFGKKNFEICFNDRDFRVGDICIFQEIGQGEYTGKDLCRRITYVLKDFEGLEEGYVGLGLINTML